VTIGYRRPQRLKKGQKELSGGGEKKEFGYGDLTENDR
jgi:hypothetical protein